MIEPVDPHDEAALTAWYAAMRAAAVEGRAKEAAVIGYQELRGMLTVPREDRRFRVHAAVRGGTVVGTLLLELPDWENRHLAEVDIGVVPGHRRQGHATELLAVARRVMAEEGRTTATGEVYVPPDHDLDTWPGGRFARASGFAVAHEEEYLVLDLPVDRDRLDTIRAEAGSRQQGYAVRQWSGACPPELLDAYARMRTAMERDVPTGDLDTEPEVWDGARVRAEEERRAEQGYRTITSVARADTGELVGYSVLLVPEKGEANEVYQDDTLVIRRHRGHRLGSTLKATNLDTLAADFPDRTQVRTWTDPDNGAMRAVNLGFGFRPVERVHEFQWARD